MIESPENVLRRTILTIFRDVRTGSSRLYSGERHRFLGVDGMIGENTQAQCRCLTFREWK